MEVKVSDNIKIIVDDSKLMKKIEGLNNKLTDIQSIPVDEPDWLTERPATLPGQRRWFNQKEQQKYNKWERKQNKIRVLQNDIRIAIRKGRNC